jgi:hypothetical protein
LPVDLQFLDSREADVEVAKGVGEAVAADAEDLEHPGLKLAAVNRVFDGQVSFLVYVAKNKPVQTITAVIGSSSRCITQALAL